MGSYFCQNKCAFLRPTDDKITGVARKRGELVYKHVSHRLLCRGSGKNFGCLIELKCNSCYAGLPEVYLLHEGCEVVGEDLQVVLRLYCIACTQNLSSSYYFNHILGVAIGAYLGHTDGSVPHDGSARSSTPEGTSERLG